MLINCVHRLFRNRELLLSTQARHFHSHYVDIKIKCKEDKLKFKRFSISLTKVFLDKLAIGNWQLALKLMTTATTMDFMPKMLLQMRKMKYFKIENQLFQVRKS